MNTVKKSVIEKKTEGNSAIGGYKASKIMSTVFFTIAMLAVGLLMVLPFLWMISASFKMPRDVLKVPIVWIPDYWYPQNFIEVWTGKYSIALNYLNSLKITSISVVGAVITSCLAGYAFAKIKFRGQGIVFLLYLSTMMIPNQVTIIPKFILFDKLGLLNSHAAIILPGLFTIFGTFLMRQAYIQLPPSLSESAYIDGASEFRIWWQVLTPLIKPSMAALMLLSFMWSWNAYEEPLIFLTNRKLLTIPVGLNNFIDENIAQYNLIMAASVSALLPVFIIFIAGQKYFVQGLTAGAVKG